jgi:hypothetical protein
VHDHGVTLAPERQQPIQFGAPDIASSCAEFASMKGARCRRQSGHGAIVTACRQEDMRSRAISAPIS